MKISVLIPVYNEVNTIEEILRRVEAIHIADEIVIVDDGSTDCTRDVLAKLNGQGPIRVFLHDKNQGKGAAVRTAIQKPAEISSSFKTLTWNMTRAISRLC
jgi:dolichol-phosphate mannosyltransferase